jgi:hypothetical protein
MAFGIGGGARPALASTQAPTDWSFYIHSTNLNTAYTLGCNQGKFDAGKSPVANSLVVLDFGGQLSDGSGSKLTNSTSVTNAQIEAIAENFSIGYWSCTGADTTSTLLLGIGTNNSYYNVSTAGGQAWAQVVSAVRAYNHTQGIDSQVSASGANDMEPSFGAASGTENWASGYSGANVGLYVDYGSADGCPTSSSTDGSCNNGWMQHDLYNVSWESPSALSLPEIYNPAQSQQWAMISKYGKNNVPQLGQIYFEGPLDEHDLDSSTYTNSQAWNQFTTDLTNAGVLSSMTYSAKIHID